MDSEASHADIVSRSEACVRLILNCLSCLLVLLRVVVISGIGEYVVVVDGIDRRVGASITIAMTIEHMICARIKR